MNLRRLAELDLGMILEDPASGFGWPITLTSPEGLEETLIGRASDISQVIDPETGQVVSGRHASVSLRISTLEARGFSEMPRAIADQAQKPWVVKFDDINGHPHTFKISQSYPDRALGVLVCDLELYK